MSAISSHLSSVALRNQHQKHNKNRRAFLRNITKLAAVVTELLGLLIKLAAAGFLASLVVSLLEPVRPCDAGVYYEAT